MSFYSQTDRRFRGLELKVALFAILSLLAVVAMAAFVIKRSDFFSPSSSVFFYVKSGEGIRVGMPVKLSGFTIGSVMKQDLADMAGVAKEKTAGLRGLAVKVTLDIKSRHLKWIPKDSQAFLRKENVIGDQIIEIIPGSAGAIMVEGDFIAFGKEKTLNDYFAEISDQVQKVQAEAGKTIDYVNDPKGEVKKALDNFHKFTTGLVETREKITQVFITMDKTLLSLHDEAINTSHNANKSINDLNKALEITNRELPKTFEKLDHSLEAVTKIVNDLQKVTRTLSSDLPQITETGLDVAQDADIVMEAAKKTWPISGNITPPKIKPLEVDSYEAR